MEPLGVKVNSSMDPYPLGHQVTKQSQLMFSISVEYYDEITHNFVPLDVCEVIFGSPYLWERDNIHMRRANKYRFIKYVRPSIIKVYQSKKSISLI